ncbi:MAG: hypothetical protein O7G83_10750, partial [Proteobacteria bacterium]|nr:hypothetical protein [Pseudomonadota bacterium]
LSFEAPYPRLLGETVATNGKPNPGRMQPGNLNTIIKIELVISLAHRNPGLYRCCTSFVNLAYRYLP